MGEGVATHSAGLVMDIRGLTPALRRPLLFTVIEKMLEAECPDDLVVVCDHEPAGLGYQLELRKDTKGRFEFGYDQRLDGAWVAMIKHRKPGR